MILHLKGKEPHKLTTKHYLLVNSDNIIVDSFRSKQYQNRKSSTILFGVKPQKTQLYISVSPVKQMHKENQSSTRKRFGNSLK